MFLTVSVRRADPSAPARKYHREVRFNLLAAVVVNPAHVCEIGIFSKGHRRGVRVMPAEGLVPLGINLLDRFGIGVASPRLLLRPGSRARESRSREKEQDRRRSYDRRRHHRPCQTKTPPRHLALLRLTERAIIRCLKRL